MRVIYDNVGHGSGSVTDAFPNMSGVMGANGRSPHLNFSALPMGRVRWLSLAKYGRFWPRWLGEFEPDEVGPLIKKWALRLRRKRQGYIYVMYRRQFEWIRGADGKKTYGPYLISIFHVPYIDRAVWDAGPHFTRTPPVKGWPQQIRC